MKTIVLFYLIVYILVSTTLGMKFNIQAKSSIFEEDESSISYRSNIYNNDSIWC